MRSLSPEKGPAVELEREQHWSAEKRNAKAALPPIVDNCIEYIEQYGVKKIPNLFVGRKGDRQKVKQLSEELEDFHCDPDKLWKEKPDVKLVCGALSHYLRGLTDYPLSVYGNNH